MPRLSEIERTFAYALRPVLENKSGNWEFQELYEIVFKLTHDPLISASDEYRRKTRNRLFKHLMRGNVESLLKFAWNIIMEADGFGVIDIGKK
jgi:hypothetical protein